jgi:hypothetical protein
VPRRITIVTKEHLEGCGWIRSADVAFDVELSPVRADPVCYMLCMQRPQQQQPSDAYPMSVPHNRPALEALCKQNIM